MGSTYWIHMDMDAFFASVEIASRPYLKGKPVAVGGSGNSRTVVAAASYAAREYGIHAGMPSVDAFMRCPSIIMIRPDMKKYECVSRHIFDMVKSYAGNITVYSIDECFVEAQDREHALLMANHIRDYVKTRHHITCSAGIADNKLIAKMASDEHKPDGLTVIDDSFAYVGQCHVSDVPGIGRKTTKALAGLGIHYVKDIREYPLYILKKHFNSYAYVLKEIAQGRDSSNILWNIGSELKSVGNTHTMERDVIDKSELGSMLSIIAEHVALRMNDSGVEGNIVTLVIRYSDFATFSRRRKIYTHVRFPEEILFYASQILNSIPLQMSVRLIGISISGLRPVSTQLSFDFQHNEKLETLEHVIIDIKSMFGEWALMRGSSLGMHRREFMHFGGIDARKRNRTNAEGDLG